MATLEKIRSKSVLLFTIIIVALLAFILGDFLTSGRTYFSNDTIAEAGGVKVDYNTFKTRLDAMSENNRQQGRDVDNDMLTQQTISTIIGEELVNRQIEQLGIKVTDSEISQIMTGDNSGNLQFIQYIAGQLQLPEANGKIVYDFMNNPVRYNMPAEVGEQVKAIWAQQEQLIEDDLKQGAFYRMVQGLFTANELDAQSMYADNNTTRHIAYVAKDYISVPDEGIEVTDNDLKAKWEERKAQYRLDEESRYIDYITVRIAPSQNDLLAGSKEVEDGLMALREQDGVEGISSNFEVTNYTLTKSQLKQNQQLRNLPDSVLKPGAVHKISNIGNSYSIAKVLNVTSEIDSINISAINVANAADADSLMEKIDAGVSFSELVAQNPQTSMDSVWNSLVNLPATSIKEKMENAQIGQAFVVKDTIQGQPVAGIYKVNNRHNPVDVYEIAHVSYTVYPSSETINNLTTKLHNYIALNSDAENFAKNAVDSGYTVAQDMIGESSPRIGNIADSRQAIKWAMDAKKGKVSPVFSDSKQSYLLAVAVNDIFDGEYEPWTSARIKDQLKAQVINDKKAAKVMDQYKGKAKDLAGYADLMGTEIGEGDVVFASPMLATIGFSESELQGRIAAAKEGTVVGPVKGNRSIVVFEVKSTTKEGRPYDFRQDATSFMQKFGITNPLELLLGKEKIENHSLKLIQSTED